MQILQRGQHPNERTCDICKTVYIFDEGDLRLDKGRRSSPRDREEYSDRMYPDARQFVRCPLCGNETVARRLPDYDDPSPEQEDYRDC